MTGIMHQPQSEPAGDVGSTRSEFRFALSFSIVVHRADTITTQGKKQSKKKRRETTSKDKTSRHRPSPRRDTQEDYVRDLQDEIQRLSAMRDTQTPLIENLLLRNEALERELRSLQDMTDYRRKSIQEYLETTPEGPYASPVSMRPDSPSNDEAMGHHQDANATFRSDAFGGAPESFASFRWRTEEDGQ
jgi:hypothetical protein